MQVCDICNQREAVKTVKREEPRPIEDGQEAYYYETIMVSYNLCDVCGLPTAPHKFRVTETYKGVTNVYADNIERLDQAIELARGGVEQESQNGYHVVFQVVDAAGAVVYNSESDTDPRTAFFRDNALVINPPPMPK